MDLDNINDKVGDVMKNKMARQILQDILQQHDNPAEKRALESAIAALEYCEKQGLTYYIEGKYFGEREEE